MEIKDTYAIGSSLLTYDIIEKILKTTSNLPSPKKPRRKFVIAVNTSTARQMPMQHRFTESPPVSALFVTSRSHLSSYPPYRRIS